MQKERKCFRTTVTQLRILEAIAKKLAVSDSAATAAVLRWALLQLTDQSSMVKIISDKIVTMERKDYPMNYVADMAAEKADLGLLEQLVDDVPW